MSALRDGELHTAALMAAALRAGEVTSVEIVERALRRAQSWQPIINAYSQLWADESLEEARRVDRLRPAERAPYAGVPIAVKDLFDVAGHETTGCCDAYRGTIARADAPVIERLRGQGPVVIEKTNQHELAAGGTNLVSACGRTGNPWDPDRMTGGSSGGSAAAVAAGVVPWSLGSDTGGSIRIPASMCGTFGLKPTYGALPTAGLMPLAPSMDCPGPLAATATDLGILFGLMGGAAGDTRERPTRIGVPGGYFAETAHDEVLAAVLVTGRALEAAGMTVEPVDGHGLEAVRGVWMRVCCPEFAEAHPLLKDPTRRRLVAPSVVEWLELGESQTPEARAQAMRDREGIARWFRDRLRAFDALLIPTTPYPAPQADQLEVELGTAGVAEVKRIGPGWMTSSVNLAGLPALTLPAGRSAGGLPVGVSLVGRDGEEGTLIRLAEMWEMASGYHPAWPELPVSP
jgi:Asp-tRNA(Asn)/Glu-tRNA(Gln) amidotransferase A subunit family amidase